MRTLPRPSTDRGTYGSLSFLQSMMAVAEARGRHDLHAPHEGRPRAVSKARGKKLGDSEGRPGTAEDLPRQSSCCPDAQGERARHAQSRRLSTGSIRTERRRSRGLPPPE